MSRAVRCSVMKNSTVRSAQSDIHGSLAYVASQPRPKLSGSLVSNQLLFADLAPLIGADSNAKQKARGGESKQPAGQGVAGRRVQNRALARYGR